MVSDRMIVPHGRVPHRGLFNRALLESKRPNYPIRFRNDPRVGSVDLDGDQFYNELVKARKDGTPEALEWLRTHLYFLGIRWDNEK